MRECKNQMVLIGTLKSKKVNTGFTKKANEPFISVDLTVVSKDGDKIHENVISLWAKQSSKLAKGYQTIASEYKTIEADGDKADRIRIDGSIEMNEYVTKDGELKTINKLRGVFVERVTDPNVKDECGISVECVVLGYTPELDKQGMPSGRDNVVLYTVGYNSIIHELQKVKIDKELSAQFKNLYTVGSTGTLLLKYNNYAELAEQAQPVQQPQTLGFGATLDNMPNNKPVKNYVNELVIIGGNMPLVQGMGAFTQEEIAQMRKNREMATQEKVAAKPVPPTSFEATGFGRGMDAFNSPAPENNGIADSDMPF